MTDEAIIKVLKSFKEKIVEQDKKIASLQEIVKDLELQIIDPYKMPFD